MIEITVSEELKAFCPRFQGAALLAKVENTKHCLELWEEINIFADNFKLETKISDIRHDKNIAATREAYRTLGKDPNRYRPSAEALRRRIVRELPLYQIDTLVDTLNLVSMKTGYSLGGFDFDKIKGGQLELGVGKADEHFEAIGRGILNIEGLPVYRDETGGIGTPTSDEERTKIDLNTNTLLVLINGYSGREGLQDAIDFTQELLRKYAKSSDIEICWY